mmetsp:Transcript_12670/g.22990  ORF Transcript_12670/g.22990 Transcript_12670/m.22990 type:complete len:195 (+) Transcript_12670:1-585(+)
MDSTCGKSSRSTSLDSMSTEEDCEALLPITKVKGKFRRADSILVNLTSTIEMSNKSDLSPSTTLSKQLTITNTGLRYVPFKIKTNAPCYHEVAQSSGFIPPGQKATINISVKNLKSLPPKYQPCLLLMWCHVDAEIEHRDGKPVVHIKKKSMQWQEKIIPCELRDLSDEELKAQEIRAQEIQRSCYKRSNRRHR